MQGGEGKAKIGLLIGVGTVSGRDVRVREGIGQIREGE